jgi:hypothetical protein
MSNLLTNTALLPMTCLIESEIQDIDFQIAALQTRRRNAQRCLDVALGSAEDLEWVKVG